MDGYNLSSTFRGGGLLLSQRESSTTKIGRRSGVEKLNAIACEYAFEIQ